VKSFSWEGQSALLDLTGIKVRVAYRHITLVLLPAAEDLLWGMCVCGGGGGSWLYLADCDLKRHVCTRFC